MQRVGSREFKNRMGRYLRAVRRGQTLLITDRGRAVAQVAPPTETDQDANAVEQKLRELESQGLIHLAKKRLPKFRPVKNRGKLASQIIIEDRR